MAATAASTMSAAAAVTRRINVALQVDATNGDVAAGTDGQNGRRSPAAKRVNDGGRKDDVWVAVDEADVSGASGGDGGGRPPLFRTYKVKGGILHPYRFLILARLIAIVAFFAWRIRHKNRDGAWLWTMSMVGDVWFGVSWVLNQLPKLRPIKRVPDLAALADRQHGSSGELPGVDVFVTTVDPVDEPILYTVNTILSILAADYPVDKYACYLSDDGGTLVHYEAMVEVAKFAELWVPFCRKHCVEPRAPENYFATKTQAYKGGVPGELMSDHRRVRREYEEFKVRIDSLSSTIRQRSDVYNAKHAGENATWMADGTHWPGTWFEQADNHRRGQHAGIVQVILNRPSCKPRLGLAASANNQLDFSGVDVRLPMLVYISREKLPGYNHQKKAGAMNVMLRVSALLSNAPFVINFDGDHYVNNSQAFRATMCFMLDGRGRGGENTAFVQFPQRFDDVDPTDRYANHNRVFFDGTMLSLNGLQGPSYLGTGTMFRRVALYGVEPSRWGTAASQIKAMDIANKFGSSTSFVGSMLDGANQERSIIPLVVLDESIAGDLVALTACAYEDGTRDGGRGDRVPDAPAGVALRVRLRGARRVPRNGADQPHRAPLPDPAVVGRLPRDVLLPQQRPPRRPPPPPAAARRLPQHVDLPDRHRVHLLLQSLPGDVANLRAVLHPAAVRHVPPLPRRRHRHDPCDRHVRGEVGGHHAAGLVPQRAVLHDRIHGGVPDGGAVHGAQALHRERHPLQAHVETDDGQLRRQVRGPVHRAVGASADPDHRHHGGERRRRRGGGRQGGGVGAAHRAGVARRAWDGVQRVDPRAPLPVRARGDGSMGEEAGGAVHCDGDGRRRCGGHVRRLRCTVPS